LEDSEKSNPHIFVIDNDKIAKQRANRAFCVVVKNEGESNREAWYIDGRMPHATLLRRLENHYKLDIENEETYLGFLDPAGFEDSELIQDEAKKRGHKITWFIKAYVSPKNNKNEKNPKNDPGAIFISI